MSLLLFYCVIALLVAVISLWSKPQFPRASFLLLVAALPQVASLYGVRHTALALFSLVFVGIWVFYNRTIPGIPLIMVGVSLNLIVMAFHGGSMPVLVETLERVGASVAPGTPLIGSKDLVVAETPFWFLADWITVFSLGEVKVTSSPGDLIVGGGICWWLLGSSRPKGELNAHPRNACV
jgi:hypothetical protein